MADPHHGPAGTRFEKPPGQLVNFHQKRKGPRGAKIEVVEPQMAGLKANAFPQMPQCFRLKISEMNFRAGIDFIGDSPGNFA